MPSFEDLEKFIRSEAKIVARQPDLPATHNRAPPAPVGRSAARKTHAFVVQEAAPEAGRAPAPKPKKPACAACKSSKPPHPLYRCDAFQRMAPLERFSLVRKAKLCYNCFQAHFTAVCPSDKVCNKCSRRHNSMLHLPEPSLDQTGDVAASTERVSLAAVSGRTTFGNDPPAAVRSAALVSSTPASTTVLLSTAQVSVVDSTGKKQIIRILLDSGSQGEFISRDCCRRLGLRTTPASAVVDGLGNKSTRCQAKTSLTFSSMKQPGVRYSINASVLEEITTELPSTTVSLNGLPHLEGLDLADATFNIPGPIDVLVGASLWAKIVGFRQRSGPPDCPTAIESSLGWIVIGTTPVGNLKETAETSLLATGVGVEAMLQKFWQIEELPSASPATPDELACEELFQDSVSRDSQGRYMVGLPFRESVQSLGDSLQSSTKKFISQERRLLRSPALHEQYCQVMRGHLTDGYISAVPESDLEDSTPAYHVPHHAVMKPDSTSTPLRIVWNMSAPTSTGCSLNDLLHIGPKLQSDIFRILLNFRLFRVALSSDVRQMYLRILVRPQDRRFQRFIWRFSPDDDLTLMQCNTVVFGMSCSPYLAQRVLRHLAEACRQAFPLASKVISRDIFMDDFVGSAASEREAMDIRDQLVEVFQSASFTLAKWCSNMPSVLVGIPPELQSESARQFDAEPHASAKILGLYWMAQADAFAFKQKESGVQCTKRNILSSIAKIFDPLGLLSPVIIVAKILIKKLWMLKIDWDEPPPLHIVKEWEAFAAALPCLASLSIPRHVGASPEEPAWLIGFCDASMEAYGAVVYVRAGSLDRPADSVRLLCAKSKVAPMNVLSIPRLELCAALLLAKLVVCVTGTYADRFSFASIYACTDSTVTLQWLSAHPSRWKTFVCNRVTQIQECLDAACWRHVPGDTNPADCLSRGLPASELANFPLWLEGPSWLHQPEDHWPLRPAAAFAQASPPEESRLVVMRAGEAPPWPLDVLLNRISSLRRLHRVTAWILRASPRNRHQAGALQAAELQQAELLWIAHVQKQYLTEVSAYLSDGSSTGKKGLNPLIGRLDLFMVDGIIRVGGRLRNASVPFEQRHPALLPKEGRYVELLVEQVHKDNLHTGPHLVLALLRSRFWILSARNLVRRLYHKCNVCFRANPKPTFPKMAALPSCHLQEAKAFTHTGVDYAGPLDITVARRRGGRSQKAYICLFVCMSTKAVHLELTSELSTPCFLAAFRRFLSRRGPCAAMYSDQGTNFVGARTCLREMHAFLSHPSYASAISDELSHRQIAWHFNPPAAPHFGGLWESNIKSAKSLLFKTIGSQLLTYEEMSTLLAQIEAILNSRPLCELSNDPAAPAALTPAHFLTFGSTLEALPAPDVSTVPSNRLSHYERVNWIVQHYWQRWSQEYLHGLQQRRKWTEQTPPLEKGALVVLMQERTRPLSWPIAVVEELLPGKDGVVRTARIRLGKSSL
ncbi:unnamed protein product, partial [Nesidiocoris tenuis]